MLKALIFDVDGTLAETEEFHRRAFNRAFAEAGLGWHWEVPLYRELLQVTGGKERIAAYLDRLPPRQRPADAALVPKLHARKTALYEGMAEAGEVPLRPGIKRLVDEAVGEGLSLAIATTTSLPNIRALLEQGIGSRWQEIFTVVAAGDMVAAKKPAADVYLLALARLGLLAAECIAIEDSSNGVAAAKAAGLAVVAVRSEYLAGDDLSAANMTFADTEGLTLQAIRELGI